MTQSVLITGGLGYVGGRVARELSKNKQFDLAVTTRNPATAGLPEWLSKEQCKKLDMLDGESISNVCKDTDIIIHFAALNEIDSVTDPESALLINTLGTLKLVNAAKKAGVKKFIYFSTAHIYRSPLVGFISEASVPRPVHPYAITHRAAEDFVLSSNTEKKMTGIVLRLSNSIGAPISTRVNRWSLAGNDLCRQVITSREIRLKTPGLQKRDFIALTDVARAVSHMIHLPESSVGDGIFNLGGENVLSIFELAARIQKRSARLLGFNPPIVKPELLTTDKAEELAYSIGKLKSTGFTLQGDLDLEIDETLLFCKEHVKEL